MINAAVRIGAETFHAVTDVAAERNIYAHPNPLARDIFWQRLDRLHHYLKKHAASDSHALDFGGGSGAFLKGMRNVFDQVELVDLDPEDAIRLCDHLKLDHVTVHRADVNTFTPNRPYDVVVLADVLEHFSDLSVPVAWLNRHLSDDGKLFVSLPTENWLYELGRTLVRKTKPADHYHAARDVIRHLTGHGFEVVERSWAPTYLVPIPLFEIAVLKRDRLPTYGNSNP